MKIYVLHIWGHPYAFYSSIRKARRAAKKIAEPTSTAGEGTDTCEYSIERWYEGQDTQYARLWQEEFEIPSPDYERT